MARTPVVVQEPPKKGRTPVVLRDGPPPKDKRAITDLSLGVVGAVLLLLAVALFGILPEEEVPPRQWQVSYTEARNEIAEVQDHAFQAEQTHRFLVDIPFETIHSIQFTVEATDDVASSLPDVFAFQILDPDGQPVSDEIRYSTPESTSDGNPVLPAFTAGTLSQVITATVEAPPRSGSQSPSDDDEDLPNAQARISDELRTRAAGEWALEVRLVSVGDCPDPTADPGPALACQTESQQQGDAGNNLQVVKVSFTTYEALVEE